MDKMGLKHNLLFLMCRSEYFLKPKSFSKIPSDIKRIPVTLNNINNLHNTTNNVVYISTDEFSGYFRECKLHCNIHEYVDNMINEYYSTVDKNDILAYIVKKSLEKPVNFKKFIKMGIANNPESAVYKFFSSGNPEFIGINSIENDNLESLTGFVQYVWGELYAYWLNNGLKNNEYQTYNACRCFGTERVAKLLKIPEIIPHTEYVVITIEDGSERFGTIMECAPGECLKRWEVNSRRKIISPLFQHQLNNLNVLDVLCYEKDHKPSNYNVLLTQDGMASNICAFDNDSPTTFFSSKSVIFNTYMNCSPLINSKGEINRPHMDKNLAETILNLSDKDIEDELQPYFYRNQVSAVKIRLKKLQSAIKATTGIENFLLNDNEWNERTMEEELDYKYGKTYLCLFCEDLKLPEQPWLK